MPTVLAIGDLHAEAHDLDDVDAVMRGAYALVLERKPDVVLLMGDQHDAHDAMSVRVLAFYRKWYDCLSQAARVVALVGNHDRSDPTKSHPHSMLAYPDIEVVDTPKEILSGVGAMPYYSDSAMFVEHENELNAFRSTQVLYCHGTFLGARYDNGFFAKDAVDLANVKTPKLVSGHIHATQRVGNRVYYVGSPRWRTESDAATANRALWLFHHGDDGSLLKVEAVRTDAYCRRIYVEEDRPDKPMSLDLSADMLSRAQVRVKVYGPTSEATRARAEELKAKYGDRVRVRCFPDRVSRAAVTESEGVSKAFDRYADKFIAPHGTPAEVLRAEVSRRSVWPS